MRNHRQKKAVESNRKPVGFLPIQEADKQCWTVILSS
jgi:hypothetical protein